MCLGEVLSLKVVLPGGRGKWCTMMEWHIWIGAGVLDMDKGWGGREYDIFFKIGGSFENVGGEGLVYPFLLELPLRFEDL